MSKREQGFSLVEVLVIGSIVLTLSAVSLPPVTSTLETYNLYKDAHRIVAQCQNARFRAISSNVRHRLHMNGDNLEVQRQAPGGYVVVETYRLTPGITVASHWSADPVFLPRGIVMPASSLTLANRVGRQRTISVSLTGVVREQ